LTEIVRLVNYSCNINNLGEDIVRLVNYSCNINNLGEFNFLV